MEQSVYAYTLDEVRGMYTFCTKQNVSLRDYITFLVDNPNTKDRNVQSSCDNHGVDLQRIIDDDNLIEHNGYYFCADDYVLDYYGDLQHRDDTFWCDYEQQYFPEDEMERVYIGRQEYCYSNQYVRSRHDLYYYDGDYYDYDALDRHDLVIMEDGEVADRDRVYYWESDGGYHYEPEPNDRYVDDYHNGQRRGGFIKQFDGDYKFRIGYEIEKEDQIVKECMNIQDFNDETQGIWRKERDGSLDDESGYELVSPTFDLDIDKIFEYIERNKLLVKHINADYSKKCGGHINVSEVGLSGDELFDKVKGYNPLIYAMYHGRVGNTYCSGKSNYEMKRRKEKYQAIAIHDNRIEYRIISAVRNVDNLKWRTKVIEFILNNPTDCPIQAFYNVHNNLKPILEEVYNTDEKFTELSERIVKFTNDFENITINNNTNDKQKED